MEAKGSALIHLYFYGAPNLVLQDGDYIILMLMAHFKRM